MPKELINPNWHVILIHYPLGVFFLGLVLEMLFLVFRYHGPVRAAARWMVVLGAVVSLPAAYSGMYALADVARRTAPAADHHASWNQVAAQSSLTADQWELLDSHAWSNGGSAVLAALVATLAVACTDRWRQKLYPVFLVLFLLIAVAMARGAWFGGEMVYREGIAVKLSASPGEQRVMDPVQAHVTLAGLAAAMGMLGIGLSIRTAATAAHWTDPELARAGAAAPNLPQRGGAEDLAMLRSFSPQVEVTGEIERIPVGRFWLLAFVAAALTSLAGWWALGFHHGTYDPKTLWSLVTGDGHVRRLAHLIAGVAIIVLPLLMALLARVARRSRVTVTVFALLLVLALAAQVWLGILLLFDQPDLSNYSGPWYRFQQVH